jgi:triosephosphate isomerase
MRRKIVAGNWKMNTTLNEGLGLATEIKGMHADEVRNNAEVILFPPFVSIYAISKNLEGFNISVGAQNMSQFAKGAYTGEISATMLQSIGCEYVIIGHSERRQYFGETNAVLNEKVKAAIEAGLVPLYCVGETLEQRENGSLWEVLKAQTLEGLEGVSNAMDVQKIVLAYEPVWAIGTGKTASTAQAQEVHAFLRKIIADKLGDSFANQIRILYGGSVKPDNATELFASEDIDGGLIGGAALASRDFCEIIKAAK